MTLPDFLVDHPDGEIRFVGSRIGIEDVVRAFVEGYTPEMIFGFHPSLSLLLIYKAIVFYLENATEVDAVIEQTNRQIAAGRNSVQPDLSLAALRQRAMLQAGLAITRSA